MKVCVRTLSALGLSMVVGLASITSVAQESLPPVKKGTQGTSKAGSTPSTKSPANSKSANPPQTERPAEREASPKNGGNTGPATKAAPATKAPAENVS